MVFRFAGSVLIALLFSCIERIDDQGVMDDLNNSNIVIEGFVSDQPGPYSIGIFFPSSIGDNVLSRIPVPTKRVTLISDVGEVEDLISDGSGIHKTSEVGIIGVIGREYKLRIELLGGEVFESEPEVLAPVGPVTDVRSEFVSFKPLTGPTEYGFKVFMDAENQIGSVRWRFSGTYLVETFPKLRTHPKCKGAQPSPPTCSGYIWVPEELRVVRIGECTCCYCWARDNDKKPFLSDEIVSTDGSYKNIEIAFIPFDVWRFHFGKYMIKVEQMSLSGNAFEFWKIIRDQKNGSTSLFQPAIGRIKTNFSSKNSDRQAIGFFYATSIKQKVIFLGPDDARIPVPEFDLDNSQVCLFQDECNVAFPGASRTPPPEWE